MGKETSGFKTRSNTDNLAQAILVVTEIVQKYDIQCWLCYGALLGMVRENRLLPWNNDAELGCWHTIGIENKFKLIVKELISKGYNASYYSTIGTLSVKHDGVDLNINCFWKEGDNAVRPHESPSITGSPISLKKIYYFIGLYMGVYQYKLSSSIALSHSRKHIYKAFIFSSIGFLPKKTRKRLTSYFYKLSKKKGGEFQKTAIPIKYFHSFITINFYGGIVFIPENPKSLLKFLYGENWNTPKDQWSFYKDENKSETSIKFIDEAWSYEDTIIL